MNAKAIMLALTAMFATANVLMAAEPAPTEIKVEKMHCAGCAKKIAARLYAVRGVKEVRVNVEEKVLFVLPANNAAPSPRAMWIAVENAKDAPLRLAGPSGTFTKKPNF